MITFVVLVRCVYVKTVMEHFLSLRSGVGINVVLSAARNLTAVLGERDGFFYALFRGTILWLFDRGGRDLAEGGFLCSFSELALEGSRGWAW